MTDVDRKAILAVMARDRKKALRSKKSAINELKRLGFLTPSGNMKKQFSGR